jgi:hypothetical protein
MNSQKERPSLAAGFHAIRRMSVAPHDNQVGSEDRSDEVTDGRLKIFNKKPFGIAGRVIPKGFQKLVAGAGFEPTTFRL